MYIDAHCHLFHKGYLTRRILKELAQLIADLEHWLHREKHNNDRLPSARITVKSLVRRTINVLRLIMSDSSTDVLRKLRNHYFPERYIYVPLSYDLVSCFQQDYEQNLSHLSTVKDAQLLQQFRFQLKSYLVRHFNWLKRYDFVNDLIELYNKLETLTMPKAKFKETDIYLRQINELTELKQRFPNMIYPFFYFDPRRKGLLNLLKESVGPDKPFLGVKLYTPNGYSPLDPNLMELYQWAEQNQVPITAHNAYGGFSNFVKRLEVRGYIYINGVVIEHNGYIDFEYDFFAEPELAIKERALVLNHPLLWLKVLEAFPKLRLNLAHFGGDSLHWQQLIYSMISSERFPNLYTDLSCQTDRQMLRFIKSTYWTDPIMRQRFIYGSDFYLNMFFIDTFPQYYKNFRQVFSRDEFKQLAWENPLRFLWPKPETAPLNLLV